MRQANEEMIALLCQWDPLGYGEDAYETEIVDVIEAVHRLNHALKLAKKIQSIYEFSFEEIIPLSECEKIAKKLLRIKHHISCDLF
ncbi:DUF1871 family protein [Bacillus alveayuensis]|jgi:hypothetical protein|uniref:DUF1871 family protein n=1 Tax=Aeribacillus alveayuensis TaxID=279215 RepID=UPI00126A46DF|nr:DUF1871 family protein [Bacillus alveayuensis]